MTKIKTQELFNQFKYFNREDKADASRFIKIWHLMDLKLKNLMVVEYLEVLNWKKTKKIQQMIS